ncbi:AMP-binding protein [Mycobacterium colombiense]|uniref:AMP-dependent synthetase and ligase n=1 Tax=Mycobacterium colombiense CECT 3035 TaxID=1041522 RepID=J4JVQ7_9MYCO|nr:AMP-binding protein [Mycobacterium colombiense]EJO89457.1 AMP-dependent synthetase and ligase [Mycobacterium colombiense CECT 3035]
MNTYHYVSALKAFADIDPDRVLVATPEGTISAGQLYARAAGLAGYLHRHGVGSGRPIGTMLWNRPAILESFYAALLLGSPPANVNPRYTAEEIAEVLRDCDAAALVYEPAKAADAARAAQLLDRPLLLLEAPSADYDAATDSPPPPPRELSPQDRILWYTGGTTGRPRGVIWEVDTHYRMLWEVIKPDADPPDPAELATRTSSPAPTTLPASPLAHGTAMGLALNTLNGGGVVVLHEQPSFDAAATLDLIARYGVEVLGIVGDAFARPLLAELDSGRWRDRLNSLRVLSSSGAVWSPAVREKLANHLPGILLIDNFGSTEALVSRDVDGKGFQPRPGLAVLGSDGQPVTAGSGDIGIVATAGRLPLGYLNDPVKTAQTFREVDGVRYLLIGDEAMVNADGTIRVLGRGNACINTGGEKVWPEEVEIVVRDHPAVADAAIIGLPDEQWGQRVTGVIATRHDVADDELSAHCRARLTPYKCPKQWIRLDRVPRTYVGKPDYGAIRAAVEIHTNP